jgi:hypothetical protein
MRRMTLARFLGLAAAVAVLVAAVNCDWWQPSFKRNPKLSLILSEREKDVSVCAPVVTPSGNGFYYLRCLGTSLYGDYATGELWKASVDGSQSHLVTDGSFHAFALSTDGTRLALATDSGDLLLADTEGLLKDTLTTVQTGTLHGVWFSRRDSERLYFGVDHLFFAINRDGSGKREVPRDSVEGFPSVQPTGHHSLVTLRPDHFQYDLGIVEAATGDSSPLHAMTYKRCWLGSEWSCWTPNEDAIFFSANEWQISDPMRPTPAEIWKYEPVFDR